MFVKIIKLQRQRLEIKVLHEKVCTDKVYIWTFGDSLRARPVKIINFEKKKIKLLTKEPQKCYENAKVCYICKKKNMMIHSPKIKNIG